MQNLLNSGATDFWVPLFTAVFTVIYAFTAQRLLLRSRARREERNSRLQETISRGFKNRSIQTVDDLVNLYKGVNRLGTDDASYRSGLGKTLREYIVGVVSDRSLHDDAVCEMKQSATALLEQLERDAPFADLPAAERNLLVDIQRFMDAGDLRSASGKLEDLAGLIEVRQDALDRAQNSNKWSVPLAAIGLVLTLVFGMVSLFK